MTLSPKYEFRVIHTSAYPQLLTALEEELNRLGAMGWYITTSSPELIVMSRLPQEKERS